LQARQVADPSTASNSLRQRQIDSSYGATFYPWVQTIDEATGQALWVPPTVAMMGVLASSEKSSQIWFAPAGFNRGGLSDGAAGIPVTSVSRRLTSKERDILYESRINPIASFPSTGIVVFGQKTLQERPSALDRINVRRLVIFLKKQISILSTQILFEQNVQATWNRFKGLIEPFLANVKTQFGITDYRLILDETTTTPDLVDQNVVYAKIMIKPARAIEYIAIDFIVASTGASFDD
jgi:phage tail sheath protein FI